MKDSEETRTTGDGETSEGAKAIPTTSTVPEESIEEDAAVAGTSNPVIESASSSSSVQVNVERQNSTSSNRSEGERERRFPFLEFDGSAPRHIQALTMIQEWARNSVSASLDAALLGTGSSSTGPENSTLGERERIVSRGHGDTQINMPGGDLASPAPASSSGLSLPSRLARGLLQTSNFRRRPDDIPEIPVSYNQATSSATMGTAPARDREGLTLDLERGGGGGGGNGSWDNANTNNERNNDVPEQESRRTSADGQSGRRPSPTGTGTATPTRASAEGTPTAPGDILRDSPETRAFIEEINQYTTLRPFLILMLLKSLVDHGSGIVCFLALIVTFSHANSLLKKEISKQRKRNLLFLVMIIVNLIGCAAFIYYVFSDEELHYALGFMSTKVDLKSFWMLIWVVGVTDYIAKFGAIVAKAFIVAMPTVLIPFQKRGIYYLFIEQTSQLYRSALPAHPWLLYLVNSYDGSMKMFGLILAGMYTLFKLLDSVQRVKDWNNAFRKLFQNVHYGTTLTAKELDSMDSVICPICHDSFTSPTRLSCSHVFCEECVSTWFDRGMTCPMCRAKVVDDPSFRDGTTAQYIQFF